MHATISDRKFWKWLQEFFTSFFFLCFNAFLRFHPLASLILKFHSLSIYESSRRSFVCDEGNLFLTNLLHLILLTSQTQILWGCFNRTVVYPSAFLNLPTQTKKSQFRCLPFKPTLSEAVAIMSSHFPYVYIVISSHHKKRGWKRWKIKHCQKPKPARRIPKMSIDS